MNVLFRISLAASLSLATPLYADGDPAAPFVTAWQGSDVSAFTKAMGNATYVDGDYSRDIDPADLPAYFEKFRGGSLKLVGRKDGAGTVELSWSLHAEGAVDFTDTLTFIDGKLSRVVTKGVLASTAETAWAKGFEAARRDSTDAVFRPVFTPDARIFGRNFPSEGATVDGYFTVLNSIAGTIYKRLPDSPVRRAKDGHLYYDFELRYASGSILIGGRDHIYRKGRLVERLVGVY